MFAFAISNLVQALLMLGDWDGAQAELTAAEADGLGGQDSIVAARGMLAALRGDATAAQGNLDALANWQASDDAQDQAMVSVLTAFTAAASGQQERALEQAMATIAHVVALGMTSEAVRWAWPLAARTAWQVGDNAATTELLRLADERQPGLLGPLVRAERDLARARLAARDSGAADAAFADAMRALREHGTPYHVAHGLLDQAEYVAAQGGHEAAATAIGEARDIATALRCQPLLDRAAALTRIGQRV
jgi:tetratricopeptide (TPR) repeat protein